jgi:hypothetical protein
MTACRRVPFLHLTLVFLGAVALSGLLWKVAAYQLYSDNTQPDGFGNCASCHELLPAGGFQSRGPLHDAHLANAFIQVTCTFCHTSTGDVPRLNSSGMTGGLGCVGCHGQPLSTGASSGAGLRRHHARTGVSVCATCHTSDPVPPPESAVPVYYNRAEVKPKTPCNTDGFEDFWNLTTGLPDGWGLDNDGDLLRDFKEDPDCGAVACVDIDQDGYGDPGDPSCRNGSVRDCDDTRAAVYPGAIEAYDQLDNNCNGQIDEIEKAAFSDPLNKNHLTWNPQPPTGQLYDVIRSDSPQFVVTSPNSTCLVVGTNLTSFDDLVAPAPRATFYYLVRNTLVNDYGKDSRGNLRLYTLCP